MIPRSVLLDKAGGRDGILCILTDFIDREVLERADQAKIIANYAVGFNNIDLEEATTAGHCHHQHSRRSYRRDRRSGLVASDGYGPPDRRVG